MNNSNVGNASIKDTRPRMEIFRCRVISGYQLTQDEVDVFNYAYELVMTGHADAARKLLEGKNVRGRMISALEALTIEFDDYKDLMDQSALLFR